MVDRLAQQFGPIRQVAYIVEDVDASMLAWKAQLGVVPFVVIRHCNPFVEMTYRGTRCDHIDISIALSMIGNVQLEFIQQHCDTPSIYREARERHITSVHHYAFYTSDFQTLYRHAVESGMEPVVTTGPPQSIGFAYVQSKVIPHLICELVQSNEMTEAMFERVAAWCRSWDGKNWLKEADLNFLMGSADATLG